MRKPRTRTERDSDRSVFVADAAFRATDDVIAQHGVLEEGAEFIQKPFSPKQLATKVRMVLGQH